MRQNFGFLTAFEARKWAKAICLLGEANTRHHGRRRAGNPIAHMDVVGARGFEPPTTATPLRCATRLRYAP